MLFRCLQVQVGTIFKVLNGCLGEILFQPGFDELMWFSDAVVPADLLSSNVVVAISGLSRTQVHVIRTKYI